MGVSILKHKTMKTDNKTMVARTKPNYALGIYIASVTFVVVTYSLVTAINYL